MRRRLALALLALLLVVAGTVGGVVGWKHYRGTAHAAACEESHTLADRLSGEMSRLDDSMSRARSTGASMSFDRLKDEWWAKVEEDAVLVLQNPDCFSAQERLDAEMVLREGPPERREDRPVKDCRSAAYEWYSYLKLSEGESPRYPDYLSDPRYVKELRTCEERRRQGSRYP